MTDHHENDDDTEQTGPDPVPGTRAAERRREASETEDDEDVVTHTRRLGDTHSDDEIPDRHERTDEPVQSNGGEFASADDFKVTRDGDGQRVPVRHEIPGIGPDAKPRTVLFRPLNYGDMKSLFGDGTVHDVNESILARVFDQHVLEPKLAGLSGHQRGRVTEDDIDEMYPMDPRYLMEGLFEASGIDADIMMQGTQGQIELSGN